MSVFGIFVLQRMREAKQIPVVAPVDTRYPALDGAELRRESPLEAVFYVHSA